MAGSDDTARVNALESRAATLQTQVAYLTDRASKAESKLEIFSERITRTEEKISHLPTKEVVVTIALGMVTLMGAIIVFQERIRTLFGH